MPRSPNFWGAILVVLAAALAVSTLPSADPSGTWVGPDDIAAGLRLQWAWDQGVHRPWWMPYLAPYPATSPHYSPSALTYALAVMGWAGLLPDVGLGVLGAGALLAGALGVYLLARRFLPPCPAAVAGVAYTLSPYALMTLYVQGDYSLLWLTALLPYWLWGWAELSARGTRRGCLALAAATAGMTAVGGASLVLLLPAAILYAGWRTIREGQSHRTSLLLTVGGGLLVSAIAWLPAVAALLGDGGRWMQSPRWAAEPTLSVGELLAWPRTVDRRALGDLLPLGLGGHLVLLALPALAHLRRQTTRPRGHVIFMLAAAVAYSLLAHPVSARLWAVMPEALGPEPYGLLGPAALAVALLVGAGVEAWSTWRPRAGLVAFVTALAVLVLGAGPYLFPRSPYPEGIATTLEEALTVPTEEHRTSVAVWPLAGASTATDVSTVVHMHLLETGPDWLRVVVDGDSDGQVLLPLGYSATTVASVDDRAQPTEMDVDTGLTRLMVGSGDDREVTLRLIRSRTGRWGSWLSLAGAVMVLLGLAAGGRQRTLRVQGAAAGITTVDLRWPSLALLLVLMAQVTYVAPRTTWFRRESPPGAVTRVEHVRDDILGGQVALLGYDLVRNLPPQGETLGLTLYWQPLEDLATDYRTFVQLVAPADGRVLWREEVATPGGLPTSDWDPNLYVRDVHYAVLPGDLPAARYQLRVGLFDYASGQALTGASGANSIYLQDIQVLYHFPLDVKRFPGRDWYRLGDQATLLGFDVTRTTFAVGDSASLTLFWRTDNPIEQRMKRFVHLVGDDGTVVAQWEDWPLDGTYPTDLWLPKHNLADVLKITMPASAPPGNYHLVVGLRDPLTLERPTVTRRGAEVIPENAVTLPVTLQATE